MTIHGSTHKLTNQHHGRTPASIANAALAPLVVLWRGAERLYKEWRSRRALEDMLALDDTLLRDMGVTPGDVQRAIHLPVSENAGASLADASRRSQFQ
jgi:uncharacterized protein YjiS (DUF1127 family)